MGSFALYVFVLAASAINVSTLEVEFSVRVWAPRILVAGQPFGMRVASFDPSVRRLLEGFQAKGHIEARDGSWSRPLFASATAHSGLSVTPALPPDVPSGDAKLVVEVRRGEHRDTCSADIRVVAEAGPSGAMVVKPKSKRSKAEPRPIHVALQPAGGVLVPELSQALIARAITEAGVPTGGTTLKFAMKRGRVHGLPETLTTDATGLAGAVVRPAFHDLLIEVTAGESPPQDVRLLGQPVQFVADAGTLTPRLGAPVTVRVDSLHSRGEVHADAWMDGRWVAAATAPLQGGQARIELPAAPAGKGPLLIQVYRNFVAPGKARYVLALLPTDHPVAALGPLARGLAERGIDGPWIKALRESGLLAAPPNPALLAQWLLSRWPDRPPEPPLLAETASLRMAEVSTVRSSSRRHLLGALGVTGCLLIFGLAYLLVFNVIQVERRWQEVRGPEDVARLGRARMWWEALLVLATLALAIVGILVMLDGLRWGMPLG